ncbi:serine/threonine-protein kinase [Pseudofrankia inefficax]|uniref:non-specific serine/threonine protein kinase n=1 Tax=Pseudofrankia inefficax (strain DSM 45817 / CECT 9037 / DDB 130130 / EuI1c) TaxID=298654 RepID=E3J220_PSEI1|nr:serine/threonine-protein kinase [Pseudofrankia inefficax]ADP84125.1 serine/threonine protein kinase [Pseudofrankia inefficax]
MARSASVPPETSRNGTPSIVAGRYRLDAPIGRGGAGVVWSGEDEVLQRRVAIKEILVPLAGAQNERDALRARVLREARALARLNSPSIVAVHDVVEESERHWIIMELVDAESLGDVIRTNGPLPPDQVAAIGLELIHALGAAHQKGVLHRDVKPGNVLLGRDGRVRLTDFGIAATEGDMTLTGTGALVGSPAYIAPERIRGSSGTPSSDLWGLAATLYSAVEGTPPYEGPETYAVLSAVVEGRRRAFRNAGPLRSLLGDLLDKPAEERPDADEVRQRLTPIARGSEPVPLFVINGPGVDGATAVDDGLEKVSDGSGFPAPDADGDADSPFAKAAALRAVEDEISSTSSDELSGLEAVSSGPFPRPRQPARRQSDRRPLVFAALAALVVVGAAVAVSLLLTHRGSGNNQQPTSVTGSPSAATASAGTPGGLQPIEFPTSEVPATEPSHHPSLSRTSAPVQVTTPPAITSTPTPPPATTPPATTPPPSKTPPPTKTAPPTGSASPTCFFTPCHT